MPSPTDDVVAILSVLDSHGVRYVVIGGIAAVLLGAPYVTYDLDICADDRAATQAALIKALEELEAKDWDPRKDEFVARTWDPDTLTGDQTWLLETKFGRLDVLFRPAGTTGFSDLMRRSAPVEVAGRRVPVTALEDLIRMKEAAGRQRDREQLPTLRKLLERRRTNDNP